MAPSSSSPPPQSSPQQLSTPESKQLVAPAGWLKKITSTTSGGTPRRGAVYFIAPDGKEIKSKRSLEGYLKSNPGGPSVTEFDWSTGETPRRSSRLGVTTPVSSPDSGAGNRRVRRKVAIEDEAPPEGNDETVGGAVSAKTEEVMEDVEEVKEKDVDEAVGGTTSAKTKEAIEDGGEVKEKDVIETVEPVEKMESDINKDVEKIVGKPEDCKINECAPEVSTEEYKNVECVSVEANKDEPQTLGNLSEVGMDGKQENAAVLEENGPEGGLVKQEEFGIQLEEAKLDKLHHVMEEAPVEMVAKHDGEATYTGTIGMFEAEDKQERSEKWISGPAQLPEAPDAQRPNGTSN